MIRIMDLIREGAIDSVREDIKNYPNILNENDKRQSYDLFLKRDAPLHCAIQHNQGEILSLLLEKKLNPDEFLEKPTAYGLTTIYCEENRGLNPLHMATKSRNIKMVKLLLKKHTNKQTYLETKTSRGFTPLHFAVENGDIAMAQLLLETHPNSEEYKDITTKQGLTPLHCAIKNDCNIENGNLTMFMLLLGKPQNIEECLEANINNGMNMLHYAVEKNNLAIVKSLLETHPNPSFYVNIRFKEWVWKTSAFKIAKRNNSIEIMTILISLRRPECIMIQKVFRGYKIRKNIALKSKPGLPVLAETLAIETTGTPATSSVDNTSTVSSAPIYKR